MDIGETEREVEVEPLEDPVPRERPDTADEPEQAPAEAPAP
jgi:hypothetical protein